MRLTLRNMLAYLDGLLEPEDAERMKAMIDESEYASELLIRVRDVMRRLRLGAPPIDGPDAVLQPNTVAEYLDNVLPPEQVPDFEKVCLESDQLLAEVAACHQILALVLGEPAHVASETRQRLYQIPSVAESGEVAQVEPPRDIVPAAALAGFASAEPDLSTGDPPVVESPANRRRPEVPEYLREEELPRRGGLGWLVPALAFIILLGVGTMVLLFSTGQLTYVARDSRDAAPPAVDPAPADTPAALPTDADVRAEDEFLEAQEATDQLGGDADAPALVTSDAPAADTPSDDTSADDTVDPGETNSADSTPSVSSSTTADESPAMNPADSDLPSSPARNGGLAVPGDLARPDAAGDTAAPATNSTAVPPLPSEGPLATDNAGDDTTPAASPAEQPLGRLVTDRTVLLRFNREQIGWEFVASRQPVFPGEQLLALPTFRSTIALSNGVSVDLRGGSAVEVGLDAPSGLPALSIDFGRVELITTGGRGAQMRVAAGTWQGTLNLEDGDSIVALEVTPEIDPGANPEREDSQRLLRVYVVSGDASWEPLPATTPPVSATAGQVIQVSAMPTVVTTSLPQWIVGDVVPAIDRKAADAIRDHLRGDRPVPLALKELSDNRLTEVRALAVRCLAYLGEYDPLIWALNDSAQHAYWQSQVDVLRDSVVRSPADAARVREALERLHPDTAAQLYRLLWGYSAGQLEQGGAVQLVESLDSPSQEIRILAFWNLRDLTGATLSYRPEQPQQRRQASVQRWRGKLNSGEITRQPAVTPTSAVPATADPGSVVAPPAPADEEP